MATHSSILAWRIPWMEEPGGLQPVGHEELDTNEQLTLSLSYASTLPNFLVHTICSLLDYKHHKGMDHI